GIRLRSRHGFARSRRPESKTKGFQVVCVHVLVGTFAADQFGATAFLSVILSLSKACPERSRMGTSNYFCASDASLPDRKEMIRGPSTSLRFAQDDRFGKELPLQAGNCPPSHATRTIRE